MYEEKRIRRYRAIAFGYGFRSEANDIAQEAFLGDLERPQWKQTPRQRVIDAIRKLYGRDVGHGYTIPLFNRLACEEQEKVELSTDKLGETDGINGADFRKAIQQLEPTERCIFVLRCIWGLDLEEIGYCFGVGQSRISQRLSTIQKRILKDLEDKQSRLDNGAATGMDAQQTQRPEIQGARKEEMEKVLFKETEGLEQQKNCGMESEESGEMAGFDEEGFPEWFA